MHLDSHATDTQRYEFVDSYEETDRQLTEILLDGRGEQKQHEKRHTKNRNK
jgi:hypothetical protein